MKKQNYLVPESDVVTISTEATVCVTSPTFSSRIQDLGEKEDYSDWD